MRPRSGLRVNLPDGLTMMERCDLDLAPSACFVQSGRAKGRYVFPLRNFSRLRRLDLGKAKLLRLIAEEFKAAEGEDE